ncbi:MAG: hypothetical protein U5R06_14385 [candidate division KSB1 bacterium]|nr:hypothetical protein [candidate division KSB1 bacterium]
MVLLNAMVHVLIEAAHFSRKIDIAPVRWQTVPNLGRTGSAVTPVPVTADSQTPGNACPRLEYDVGFLQADSVDIHVYVSPTLQFHNKGLRYGVSIDDQEPQIINIHNDFGFREWEEAVRRNVIRNISRHPVSGPGAHVVKFWMVDPAVVLQKIVIDTGGLKASYLGPPESKFISSENE